MTVEGARAYVRSRGRYIGGRSTKEFATNECVKVRMGEIMSGDTGTKFEELLLVHRHDTRFNPPHECPIHFVKGNGTSYSYNERGSVH